MKDRVHELFDNMFGQIPNQKETDVTIEKEVYAELQKVGNSEIDYEKLKDMCFSIVHTAKREYFALGFDYAIDLICKRQ